MLEQLVRVARKNGASDLHLEPGQPVTMRVRGALQRSEQRVSGEAVLSAARKLVPPELWGAFVERRSFDLSRVISGVQCRINILQSARGVGMAVRLLSAFRPTIKTLNLHPDLAQLVKPKHGLILVSGATGSGKSSTMAALIEELNEREARHIITVEDPIEYVLRARKSLIRQREVGRDTPSFEQALLDALREDPDVIMVGEMRRRNTMQLTLDAAETGHLVLATVHSSSTGDALQRLVSAFPAESQDGVRAQLADCLVAIVCQRLHYRGDIGLRVPQCEILRTTTATRAMIREGAYHKLSGAIATGRDEGMWSWDRYQRWLDARTRWFKPAPDQGLAEDEARPTPALPRAKARAAVETTAESSDRYVVDPGDDVSALIAELEKR